MPDRRNPQDVPERIELLNRALDRIAMGQPAPVLDDSELQDLLDLAGRLKLVMPDDLPDPGFRAELKSHLTAGTWASQRQPATLKRKQTRASFPYRAASAAIAAVLVAAIAVGTLAIWTNTDDPSDSVSTFSGQTGDAAPTQAQSLATESSGNATSVALAQTAPADTPSSSDSTPALMASTPETGVTATVQQTRTALSTATPGSGGATATLVTSTATPGGAATVEPTEGPQLAGVPPIDADHLEPGPVALADGGGEAPSPAVAVTLDTSLPDLNDSAPIYTLSPPEVDPSELVEGVAETLDIDGPVVTKTDGRGNAEYRADGSNGATFAWTPETGGFSFELPEGDEATPASNEATADDVIDNTREWLTSIGYPADSLTATPLAEQNQDGSWYLQIWTASMPYNSFGHPIGVTVIVDASGKIISGSGFWLTLNSQADVPILSADDAWEAITEHEGYWTGGGIAAGGGAFAVDTLFLGYTLTRDDGQEDLIYQPTIIAQGDFTAPNGDNTRITVYLQATK